MRLKVVCFNTVVLKQAFNLQIPGLYKSSSVDSLSTTKIKPLVPARASGLSKKPPSVHKRNHHNAENKPGLQIKINELWKNFVFKKWVTVLLILKSFFFYNLNSCLLFLFSYESVSFSLTLRALISSGPCNWLFVRNM